jgi:hypothetical protein
MANGYCTCNNQATCMLDLGVNILCMHATTVQESDMRAVAQCFELFYGSIN